MSAEPYITKYYSSEKLQKSEGLCLSMLISPTSFMYAISLNDFKEVSELCEVEINSSSNEASDFTDKISFLIQNHLLNKKKFEKVNLCFLNSSFTILPQAFNTGDDVKPLLQFATGIEQVKKSLQHRIKNISFCYSVEIELLNFLEKIFPNCSIRHSGAVNLSLFFSQHSLIQKNLFLNIGEGSIEVAAKEGQELLFYNVFDYQSNEDVLYYLLFTMEQLQLNPLHVKVAIAAQQESSEELIKSIKKYIKQVDLCVSDAAVNLKGELAALPKHYYFTLLNQHLCEL